MRISQVVGRKTLAATNFISSACAAQLAIRAARICHQAAVSFGLVFEGWGLEISGLLGNPLSGNPLVGNALFGGFCGRESYGGRHEKNERRRQDPPPGRIFRNTS
mgnify:CR=1 FL=1